MSERNSMPKVHRMYQVCKTNLNEPANLTKRFRRAHRGSSATDDAIFSVRIPRVNILQEYPKSAYPSRKFASGIAFRETRETAERIEVSSQRLRSALFAHHDNAHASILARKNPWATVY